MELSNLLSTITSGRIKIKEITEATDNLTLNSLDLGTFLENNSVAVSEFQVTSFLMQAATKLLEKRIPLNLVKNVYNEYSVIFAINILNPTNSKATSNKLTKIFLDIISNSMKFDIYMKVVKNLKKVGNSEDVVMEFYWLLPLFSNVNLLATIDYNKFISEMKDTASKADGFTFGYEYYVTCNLDTFDKIAYKQFLVDGLKSITNKSA